LPTNRARGVDVRRKSPNGTFSPVSDLLINQEVFFYLIPRLSAMSWSLSTDSLSRANSS